MELRQGWRLHCCPPLVATSKRSLFSHMDIMDADGDISLVHIQYIQYMILQEFTSLIFFVSFWEIWQYASKIRLTALENSCAFFIFFLERDTKRQPTKVYWIESIVEIQSIPCNNVSINQTYVVKLKPNLSNLISALEFHTYSPNQSDGIQSNPANLPNYKSKSSHLT